MTYIVNLMTYIGDLMTHMADLGTSIIVTFIKMPLSE